MIQWCGGEVKENMTKKNGKLESSRSEVDGSDFAESGSHRSQPQRSLFYFICRLKLRV